MVRPVAVAMRALHARAAQDGIHLATTGRGRTLQMQWDIFGGRFARYQPCSLAEYAYAKLHKRHKLWPTPDRNRIIVALGTQTVPIPDASYWHKIVQPNGRYPLNSATPGTSNHGWNCADDLAERVNGKLVTLTPTTRQWLYAHILDYGFAWETVADPPHVAWYLGDETPPALRRREMQTIRADNDYAVFTLAGCNTRWVQDNNVRVALKPLTGDLIVLNKLAFAELCHTGPLPPGWSPTDFASHTP